MVGMVGIDRLPERGSRAHDLVPDAPAGGADGRLALRHLPPGTYAVELRAKGARPRTVRNVVAPPRPIVERLSASVARESVSAGMSPNANVTKTMVPSVTTTAP